MSRFQPGSIGMLITPLLFCMNGIADAQIVQLPTFRTFGMSTTVSVPDRGSASLGGVSSSSMYRRERGLPGFGNAPFGSRALGNRTIAGGARTGGLNVSAQIHDFEAMEHDLLRNARGVAGRSPPKTHAPDVAGRSSIAELRRQQATRQRAEQAEARRDFERGRQLLTQGRTDMAKLYFQRASKRGDAALRTEIAATIRRPRS